MLMNKNRNNSIICMSLKSAIRNFIKPISSFIKIPLYKSFSTKDDEFWKEYMTRKAQGGRYPALESQEIFYTKTVHSWQFSENHSLTSDELLVSIRDLEKNNPSPFVIVDVREESELDLYKLPKLNRKGAEIPVIYRDINEINHGNFEDFPSDKYIVCIDSIGLRGRMACRSLVREGYLGLYVEGGYDLFIPLVKNKDL